MAYIAERDFGSSFTQHFLRFLCNFSPHELYFLLRKIKQLASPLQILLSNALSLVSLHHMSHK